MIIMMKVTIDYLSKEYIRTQSEEITNRLNNIQSRIIEVKENYIKLRDE